MTRVLCIANQKGGVGKTTTAISLAVGVTKAGARTLLIDLDPQCNATSGLYLKPANTHPLVSGELITKATLPCETPNLDVLPGSRSFRDIEVLTHSEPDKVQRMKEQLAQEINGYDFVIIDCPPSFGQLTQIALACATEVIMPIQCEVFALQGLFQMIPDITKIIPKQLEFNQVARIVETMYDYHLELTYEVDRKVREFCGEIVYQTVIPRDVAISDAAGHSLSVIDYAPRSRGARAYIELCMEILERV